MDMVDQNSPSFGDCTQTRTEKLSDQLAQAVSDVTAAEEDNREQRYTMAKELFSSVAKKGHPGAERFVRAIEEITGGQHRVHDIIPY